MLKHKTIILPVCLRCKCLIGGAMYALDKRPCYCLPHIVPDHAVLVGTNLSEHAEVYREVYVDKTGTIVYAGPRLGSREELGL